MMTMDIEFCRQFDMLPRDGLILCAVSGGKDSICLLDWLLRTAPNEGFTLCAAHFDHRLRGEESDRDRRFVEDFCREWNVSCHVGSGDVRAFAAEQGLGLEEAARRLRYAFLEETARQLGADRIATAHTAEDNAETLLHNLARGTGLRGLCGIPPVRGIIVRPLLRTSTEEVIAYLNEHGLFFVEDSTNASDLYARNRIRHWVMPELRTLNEGFTQNLIRCQSLILEDEVFLTGLAEDFIRLHLQNDSLPAAKFAALPPPIFGRALRILVPCGLSQGHVEAVRALAGGSRVHAFADLPGLRVQRDRDRLIFGAAEAERLPRRELLPDTVTALPEAGLEIFCELIENCTEIHKSFNIFIFQSDSICGNIFVKSRGEGEKIRLAGRNCTKTLKKLFSEAALNGREKGLVPVFYDEKGPLGIYGFGIAERCLAKAGDRVYRLTIRPLGAE